MARKHNDDDAGERGDRGAMNATDAAPNARVSQPHAAAVYLHIDELRPNPRNPRTHGDEVVRLARTILRTTWGAPIIAQASTRRIIGGHGRLEAARMIAEGVEVDGILRGGSDHPFDRGAPGPLMVPVRLVDVSDAEAEAMTLADNARALQGVDDSAAVVAMATAIFERDAEATKALAVERALAALDEHLVEPISSVVARDAEGNPCIEAKIPQDIEADLAMPGGHIFHGEMLPGQVIEQRPDRRRFGGIEGLYLAGSGAHPGGAVTGAPGLLAARAVLEDR